MTDHTSRGDVHRSPSFDRGEAERIYGRARELAPGERPAFVDSACSDRPALKAEVLSLLDQTEAAEAFFAKLGKKVVLPRPREEGRFPGSGEGAGPERGVGTATDDLPTGATVGRYRIEGRIGAGGMGTVYRASDPQLEREVALKFLPRHLAADPAARERFLVEARAAASLDHPNICTIHEIGEMEDGRPYLAMALYRGETLKQRIARGPLPVAAAIDVAVAIARALATAHERRIVHRDVKPGNVMLPTGGPVKLLDFGLAKPADVTLTDLGVTPGTVAYMAPEQVRGERVSERTDLWSLGVVLYEMLTGQRPFGPGRDLSTVYCILHEEPLTPSSLRAGLPAELDALMLRLLRKEPERRYANAHDVEVALGGFQQLPAQVGTASDEAESRQALEIERAGSGGRAAWWRQRSRAGLVGILLLGALGVLIGRRDELGLRWPFSSGLAGPSLDASLVAVLPFRVAGAEAGLSHLREGMVDLLAARLGGERGPRTVDPRTLIDAWRSAGAQESDLPLQEAVRVARNLGAGRLVTGEIVSLPGEVVLTASLHDVLSGRSEAPVSVEGPVDSLPSLVDRLVSGVLSVEAGEGRRLTSLMTSSPAALRLYLEGEAASREGRYVEAVSAFSRAVELDTTFALASFKTWQAAMKIRMTPPVGYQHAWRHRDRLGERDRAFLERWLGPDYPHHSPHAEVLANRAALVREQPENANAWFSYADWIPGAVLARGNPDSVLHRAMEAFSRAVALDSSFAPALEHLGLTALVLGDTAEARRYEDLFLERASTGLAAETIRCVRAARLGGLEVLPEILVRIDSAGADVANRCLWNVHFLLPETSDLRDAMAQHLREKMDDPAVLVPAGWILYVVARDGGRQSEVDSYYEALGRAGRADSLEQLKDQVRDALYWDGEQEAAARAAVALEARLGGLPPDSLSYPVADATCVLGQWRLARETRPDVAALVERLRELGGTGEAEEEVASEELEVARLAALHCAILLDTWQAGRSGAPDLGERIARLDSSLVNGPFAGRQLRETLLLLARLLEDRGDVEGALRALRRGSFAYPWVYTSTFLRERGRLAALVRDTTSAVDAYRRYLAMRTDPEPALQSEVERVRTELARLEPTPRD